jgi:YjbR
MTQPPVTFETVRAIALALPGVEEGTSYGTPAFRVRGKFLARLREDGETLVVKCDYHERDLRMEINCCKNLLLSYTLSRTGAGRWAAAETIAGRRS